VASSVCDKKFRQSSGLRRHIHTGENWLAVCATVPELNITLIQYAFPFALNTGS